MSLPRINYTKSWENPSDFPTVETSEAQIRADLQELPNQIQDQVNALIDALVGSDGAANIGAADADGNEATVQEVLDHLDGAKVRVFALSGLSDLATAQDAYDFYAAGGLPILRTSGAYPAFYVYKTHEQSVDPAGELYLFVTPFVRSFLQSTAFVFQDCRALLVVDGTVTQVQTYADIIGTFIQTEGHTAQSTAFMPQYPGQPATKKYVDDSVGTKYAKPFGGIPKTDLASDVQTSLGKADSALQQHQSLAAYRTASAQDTLDAQKYSATNPPPYPVTSVNGQTGSVVLNYITFDEEES